MDTPVDAIITWVDGNEPTHEAKLANYLVKAGIHRTDEAASPTRFNQLGELDYCVNSLFRFAPWIRTIYLVTDQQIPPLIERLRHTAYENKIKLIDHRDIFLGFESYLPTFNSLTIESMLWRIPGLSEYFIYLNDDCSLIRPVQCSDFFRDDRLVLRGTWKTQAEKKLWPYLKRFLKPSAEKKTNMHRTLQETSAKLAGYTRHFFHLPHAPFPMRKSTLAHFFEEHPELLLSNLSHPIRNLTQFWPISLAYHLEIKAKQVVFDNKLKEIMVNGSTHSFDKIQSRLAYSDKKNNIAFVCMQSIDQAPESTQKFMLDWLEQRIPLEIGRNYQ